MYADRMMKSEYEALCKSTYVDETASDLPRRFINH